MKKTISLKTIMENQKVEVFNDFKANLEENEKQSFDDFKLKFENEATPIIKKIGCFGRSPLTVYLAVFLRAELKNKITIKVDSDINQAMDNEMEAGKAYEVDAWNYIHCITGNDITNDMQIISTLNIDELFPLTEIIGNAVSLIEEDLKGNGPLHEPDVLQDRNVNLGYCLIGGKVCIVYIERTKLIKGKKREYHIHKNICPRLYKPRRHIIYLPT